MRVTGYPTRSAFFTRREKLHVNWFDQRSLFHKLSSMPFSTEGDSVSYTFYIFYERKTSCQLIWSEIPFPRTFLNVIFHRGWKGVLHILHFPQGEKIFTSIDLIKDPSSTNFPPRNFPPRVSYTFCIFHIERKYEQLYHCSFSIPSKSLKKKQKTKKEVNTLSFTIFFFFLLLKFLLLLNPLVDEILFIYLFIILLCVGTF